MPFESAYYDQPALWGKSLADLPEGERDRLQALLSLLPRECNSLLDVGCGDGVFLNQLVDFDLRACGCDPSKEALRHVKVPHCVAGAENLPFRDDQFDVVVCAQVLEHLSVAGFDLALKELMRVSRKYVLVGVPYKQNLQAGMTRCPGCGCTFHVNWHVRSFDDVVLQSLFPDGQLVAQKGCSGKSKYHSTFLVKLSQCMGNAWVNKKKAVCPQCHMGNFPRYRRNLIGRLCMLLDNVVSLLLAGRSHFTRIAVLYQKQDVADRVTQVQPV